MFWLGIFRGMRFSNVDLECRHWFCDHAGILKYPKKQGFWRHSKFNFQNFGTRGSILSFSVSLYIPWNPIISHYILLYCVCSPIVFFYDIPRIFHDVSHKSTMLSCWSRFSIPASSQPMLPDAEDCGTRGTRGAQIGISDEVFWMLRPRPWETGETGNWTKENGDFLGFYSWFMIWIAEPVEPQSPRDSSPTRFFECWGRGPGKPGKPVVVLSHIIPYSLSLDIVNPLTPRWAFIRGTGSENQTWQYTNLGPINHRTSRNDVCCL